MKLGSSFPAASCWLNGLRTSCLLIDYYASASFLLIISFIKWCLSLLLCLTSEKIQMIVCKGVSKSRGNRGMGMHLDLAKELKRAVFTDFGTERHSLRDVEEELWVKYTTSPRWLKQEAPNCLTGGDALALLSNPCTARNMKPREGRVSSCGKCFLGTVSVRQEGLRVDCLGLSPARDWFYELISKMRHFSG